jgi:hypothetical protein
MDLNKFLRVAKEAEEIKVKEKEYLNAKGIYDDLYKKKGEEIDIEDAESLLGLNNKYKDLENYYLSFKASYDHRCKEIIEFLKPSSGKWITFPTNILDHNNRELNGYSFKWTEKNGLEIKR